jgi:hypothetical protein
MLQIRSRGTDAQQAAFTAGIQAVLTAIRRTITGRTVIGMLEGSPRRVVIEPFDSSDVGEMGLNAFAAPGSVDSAGSLHLDRPAAGTGSFIHFTPGLYVTGSPQGSDDEVLLHELCHSLRQTRGLERYARGPRGGRIYMPMVSYENVEEFFAAMVASVHSSELGRRPLGNHDSAGLPDPAVLSRAPYSTRLAEIARQVPDLHAALRAIDAATAPFNPFRDYVP